MSHSDSKNFAYHYHQLEKGLEDLQHLDVSEIDKLADLVEQVTLSKKACQNRLQQIAEHIGEQWEGFELEKEVKKAQN